MIPYYTALPCVYAALCLRVLSPVSHPTSTTCGTLQSKTAHTQAVCTSQKWSQAKGGKETFPRLNPCMIPIYHTDIIWLSLFNKQKGAIDLAVLIEMSSSLQFLPMANYRVSWYFWFCTWHPFMRCWSADQDYLSKCLAVNTGTEFNGQEALAMPMFPTFKRGHMYGNWSVACVQAVICKWYAREPTEVSLTYSSKGITFASGCHR